MHAELVLHADWILPVDAQDQCLEHHSLVVDHGRIVALVPQQEANDQITAMQELDLRGHALIPGLINAHTHSPMTLLRGLADDLPMMTWLTEHIWPAEARWVDEQFVADGTRLAVLEMIRGGVTCFNDMYQYAEVTARVAAEAGMRAIVGMIVVDFPTRFADAPEAYLARGREFYDQFKGNPLIRAAFAPHATYTVSEGPLRRVRELAEELDVPVHIHLQETAGEVEQSLREHGERPLARLERLGLVGPRLVAVHMTQLEADEIEGLAATGAHVVHCPESNLKLASGFCPVARLRQAGVNVALGTDGAASNNDLNMLGELRTAALLAKGVAGDAAALPAEQALRMATINAARAFGLDREIGSLEVGKAADIVAVDLRDAHTTPVYHPCSQMVYAASSHQVRHVWINGQQVLHNGLTQTLDAEAICTTAASWQRRIAGSTTG